MLNTIKKLFYFLLAAVLGIVALVAAFLFSLPKIPKHSPPPPKVTTPVQTRHVVVTHSGGTLQDSSGEAVKADD